MNLDKNKHFISKHSSWGVDTAKLVKETQFALNRLKSSPDFLKYVKYKEYMRENRNQAAYYDRDNGEAFLREARVMDEDLTFIYESFSLGGTVPDPMANNNQSD